MSPPVEPLPIGPFNHAAINVRSVARSLVFYCELLGFSQIPRPDFSFQGAWLYAKNLGMTLHLIEDNTLLEQTPVAGLPVKINTRGPHLAFQAPDLNQVIVYFTQQKIAYEERILPTHGYRQLFFHDPDGNVIELGEWPAAATMVEMLTGGSGIKAPEIEASETEDPETKNIKTSGPVL